MHLYVVQQPKSISNKTNRYRIILHDDWLGWLNLDKSARDTIPAVGDYTTYQEAATVVDRLNTELRQDSRQTRLQPVGDHV